MNFSTDFVAPAVFYNLLSRRSPLFIKNKKKFCKEKFLRLDLFKFIPPKNGKLYATILSANISGSQPSDVIVHSTHQLKYCGPDKTVIIPYSVNKDISRQSNYAFVNLLVIIFIESTVSDSDVNEIVKDIIMNHVNDRSSSAHYFNIFEVSCRKKGTNIDISNNIRSYFSPLFLNSRQTIRLMQKLKNTFLSSPYNTFKFDITLEINFEMFSEASPNGIKKLKPSQSSLLIEKSVFIHYLHFNDKGDSNSNSPNLDDVNSSMVEANQFISCPWCDHFDRGKKDCIYYNSRSKRWSKGTTLKVLSLLSHLDSSHLHFSYSSCIDEYYNLHIVIQRDRNNDVDSQTVLKERLRPFKLKINKSMTDKNIFVRNLGFNSKFKNETIWDKENGKQQSSAVSEKSNVHSRQYYHARLGYPLTNYEFLNCDSDDEIDMNYEKNTAIRSLDEFEDIPSEEKELMKMWNFHINNCTPYANQYLSIICEIFAINFGKEILGKKLRHNLLIHFLNLVDFNLIRKEDVKKCMEIIDNFTITTI